jgi:hypothetical protein
MVRIQYLINTFSSAQLGYLVAALLLAPTSGSSAPVAEISYIPQMMAPSLNPPHEERPEQPAMRLEKSIIATLAAVPSVEWTYHRTADGQHPNGDEQQIMWLMNRARQNPVAEGVWLATAPEFTLARNYFQVNTQLLQTEFASYASKPPGAFDRRLYHAAKAHSDDLIIRDAQDHVGQLDRIDAAGFQWQSYGGNVFSYATDALNAHGGWNIDWGFGSGGMQDGRGHRIAIMAVNYDYTNVGIAAVPESNANTAIGPLVVTGNYCQARENSVDHFNRFIVGTVWRDQNSNSRYDPGEGLPNILITPNQGQYFAITAAGGGYAIPITTSGAYQITFSGSGIHITQSVQVNTQSVLLDLQPEQSSLGSAVGVFRAGTWFLDANGNSAWDGCPQDGGQDLCLYNSFGTTGDLPATGHWDGGAKSSIGVLRPGAGEWFIDRNGNRQWDGCVADGCYAFGQAGDLPVAGDWNGTGFAKIGVFRHGQWYLDANGNGQWDGCGVDRCFAFGQFGDLPVAGNWGGGIQAGVGVFRAGTWYLDDNGNGAWDGCQQDGGQDRCLYNSFGQAGDLPAAGDWNGDGVAKVGVFRNGTWYLDYNGNGAWDGCGIDRCYEGSFGMKGDLPVAGQW